ncbi:MULTISPECIES: GntR family transcriptional regulator [Bacillaceae]|uniref:GntR family transcriptional regulator n=1 Tax=Bacillus mesophilum TaxID=1071718 RepID=A0A7V7V045_9BACI|nr:MULTISPECIES: GntR family transcriptional regulator [Bacillaceae]KAB2334382.1 GntR family transcriptional regulator [Bacillus mesophilum]
MGDQFQASKPIYMQIVSKVQQQIIRGDLQAGSKLPSVREMAIQSGVNPNTIQRTYSELERTGIVLTKRGQGTFVTEEHGVIAALKREMQDEVIHSFVNSMKELGVPPEQLIQKVEDYLEGSS